jgi:hypothetical protein
VPLLVDGVALADGRRMPGRCPEAFEKFLKMS